MMTNCVTMTHIGQRTENSTKHSRLSNMDAGPTRNHKTERLQGSTRYSMGSPYWDSNLHPLGQKFINGNSQKQRGGPLPDK